MLVVGTALEVLSSHSYATAARVCHRALFFAVSFPKRLFEAIEVSVDAAGRDLRLKGKCT